MVGACAQGSTRTAGEDLNHVATLYDLTRRIIRCEHRQLSILLLPQGIYPRLELRAVL